MKLCQSCILGFLHFAYVILHLAITLNQQKVLLSMNDGRVVLLLFLEISGFRLAIDSLVASFEADVREYCLVGKTC